MLCHKGSKSCSWACVKPYLHSDCAFFGHSLVHPNEGHIVVKVIDWALKIKSEARAKMNDKYEGLQV